MHKPALSAVAGNGHISVEPGYVQLLCPLRGKLQSSGFYCGVRSPTRVRGLLGGQLQNKVVYWFVCYCYLNDRIASVVPLCGLSLLLLANCSLIRPNRWSVCKVKFTLKIEVIMSCYLVPPPLQLQKSWAAGLMQSFHMVRAVCLHLYWWVKEAQRIKGRSPNLLPSQLSCHRLTTRLR